MEPADVGGMRFDQSLLSKAGCSRSWAAVRGVLFVEVGWVVAEEGVAVVVESVIFAV